MRLVERYALIDDVLDAWGPAFADARPAYSGHVYRVFNFARAVLQSGRRDDELALASAFHDIGIWSDATFDYLEPSIGRASDYMRDRHPELSTELVADLIRNHHLLRRARAGHEIGVVEAFRRADLVDVSGGLFRGGLERGFVGEVVARFPFSGFHGALRRIACSWFVRHPLRPLPMLRFSQSQHQRSGRSPT